MKIVVTSLGETLESPVDQRFGRARYFILYDLEAETWSVENNERTDQENQQADSKAAQQIVSLGAETVITGHCGPDASAILAAAGVRLYEDATGTIMEAIDAWKAGSLGSVGRGL